MYKPIFYKLGKVPYDPQLCVPPYCRMTLPDENGRAMVIMYADKLRDDMASGRLPHVSTGKISNLSALDAPVFLVMRQKTSHLYINYSNRPVLALSFETKALNRF